MKTAVVILNWNGAKLLEQFLPSVVKYTTEATIFVADNASTDNSIEIVKSKFPSIQIIQNPKNFGFAEGYNQSLQGLDFDIFALVNSDIEVTENWLNPIIETFKNQPKTAIVQPKILDFKTKEYYEYAGAAGGFIDKFGFPYCRGRVFDTLELDTNQYQDSEIFWASGACFFIRRTVFEELKGFDTDFFAHQEEIDLCWRAFNKGYKIKYYSKSVVYHVGGATLQQGNPKKTYLNFRNSLSMLVKNLPKKKLFPIIFIRLCLDGLAGIQFLFKAKPKHTFAILKAHFHFYCSVFHNFKKRDTFQREDYFEIKSIVYQYFIKNKKQFSKL